MTDTIVLEAAAVEQTAQPLALTPLQARNRRIFLKGIAAGVHVVSRCGETATLTSASRPGHYHYVTRTERAEYCACEWGERQGWIFRGDKLAQPCCHVLINRYDLLADEAREALLDMDPDLAAALKDASKPAERQAA